MIALGRKNIRELECGVGARKRQGIQNRRQLLTGIPHVRFQL